MPLVRIATHPPLTTGVLRAVSAIVCVALALLATSLAVDAQQPYAKVFRAQTPHAWVRGVDTRRGRRRACRHDPGCG